MENKSIAFAFYKNDKLIGYREDTIGSIGDHPKLYTYSKEQVDTVLKNIDYNVKNKTGIGEFLGIGEVIKVEREVHENLQEMRAFEVRVLEAPEREKEFDVEKAEWVINYFTYPFAAVRDWIDHPEHHVVIETHYFSMDGLINVQ